MNINVYQDIKGNVVVICNYEEVSPDVYHYIHPTLFCVVYESDAIGIRVASITYDWYLRTIQKNTVSLVERLNDVIPTYSSFREEHSVKYWQLVKEFYEDRCTRPYISS